MIISKFEMPKASDWGTFQIDNLINTYFRFEMKNGEPVLEASFFVDKAELPPEEKHRRMDKKSKFYTDVQQLLNEYITNNKEEEKG